MNNDSSTATLETGVRTGPRRELTAAFEAVDLNPQAQATYLAIPRGFGTGRVPGPKIKAKDQLTSTAELAAVNSYDTNDTVVIITFLAAIAGLFGFGKKNVHKWITSALKRMSIEPNSRMTVSSVWSEVLGITSTSPMPLSFFKTRIGHWLGVRNVWFSGLDQVYSRLVNYRIRTRTLVPSFGQHVILATGPSASQTGMPSLDQLNGYAFVIRGSNAIAVGQVNEIDTSIYNLVTIDPNSVANHAIHSALQTGFLPLWELGLDMGKVNAAAELFSDMAVEVAVADAIVSRNGNSPTDRAAINEYLQTLAAARRKLQDTIQPVRTPRDNSKRFGPFSFLTNGNGSKL